MNETERENLLNAYPVLQSLTGPLLGKIESAAEPLIAPAGRRLFEAGDPCTHHPMLLRGCVRVVKCSSNGDEILLYRLTAGQNCVITAVTLLGEAQYAASGIVEEGISGFAIPRNLFIELVRESASFRVFVFSSMAERLGHIMGLVDDLAFRGVAQRLAARLLKEETRIEATHQTLADELGTSREVVTRILQTFQQSGIVRLGRKRIEVTDRRALNSLYKNRKG